MRKKKHEIELLPQQPSLTREQAALKRLTDAVVEQIAAREENRPLSNEELSEMVFLQPWCLPPEIAHAIRQLVPVWHWRKFAWVYQDNGCWKCERTNVPHQSLGMCQACYQKYFNRVRASIARHAGDDKQNVAEMKAALTAKQDSARRILAKLGVGPQPAALPAPKRVR